MLSRQSPFAIIALLSTVLCVEGCNGVDMATVSSIDKAMMRDGCVRGMVNPNKTYKRIRNRIGLYTKYVDVEYRVKVRTNDHLESYERASFNDLVAEARYNMNTREIDIWSCGTGSFSSVRKL